MPRGLRRRASIPEYVGNMYRIRKLKVWDFLQWLKVHNRLYKDALLDRSRGLAPCAVTT